MKNFKCLMLFFTSWKHLLFLSICIPGLHCHADSTDSRFSPLDLRISSVKIETARNTSGAKMASASPLYDGYGLFVTADALFWNLKEGGSDYSLAVSSTTSLPSGKSNRANFGWNFGFRTGAGYHLEHDAWDGYLNFTWFHANAENRAHAPSGKFLSPQKGTPLAFNATKIQSRWHVHYYVLDLEIGRRYFVSKFLAFRPQFGIESAWICQRRRYEIKGLPNNTGTFGENIYGKNNFWGIGPRAGFEGAWYFGRHFSLTGAANGALQWGTFDTHLSETEKSTLGNLKLTSVKGNLHRLVPNVQMALGLSWDANINEQRNHLGIRLSYEFQYWWRQNQFLNPESFPLTNVQHESKDLSLNGVTLDVRFEF